MKQVLAPRARVVALSLLAALSAAPAAASHCHQGPLNSSPALQKLLAPPRAGSLALVAVVRNRQVTAAALPQMVTLRGIVVRATGQPCAGASVYATQMPRQLTVTDSQGAFTLSVLAETAVSLRVEYFGEGSSRVEVPLPAAALLRITLGQ